MRSVSSILFNKCIQKSTLTITQPIELLYGPYFQQYAFFNVIKIVVAGLSRLLDNVLLLQQSLEYYTAEYM